MRYLSLFSGLEGASLAWRPLGWTCVAVAETDPACCAVLDCRWPGIPNLGDVRKITEGQVKGLGHIDLVVFGSPCQDVSIAGKRAGMKGKRSELFFTAMRIIRWSNARFALWENVPGVFSDNGGRGFASVVGEMAGVHVDVPDGGWANSGFFVGPDALVEWAVLDAQFFGVPQRRRRVFALRDIGDWQSRGPILLEPESLRGDSAPRREARKSLTHDLAPSLTGSGRGVERGGDSRGQDPVVAVAYGGNNTSGPIEIATACNAHGGAGRMDFESVAIQERATCENPDAGPDGVGVRDDGTAYTLEARAVPQAVMTLAIRGREEGSTLEVREDGTANAVLTPSGGRGGIGVGAVAYGIDEEQNGSEELFGCLKAREKGGGFEGAVVIPDVADPISAHEAGTYTHEGKNNFHLHNVIPSQMAVRRLTPVECEKLQGVPPGFTLVPYRGKPIADGNRYRMLGNGFAIPVLAWVGRRIEEALETGKRTVL